VLQSFSARTEMIKRTTPRNSLSAARAAFRRRFDRCSPARGPVAIRRRHFQPALAVAAELVPAEKVRKQFGTEVESRYLVVEVRHVSKGP